ncbi:hypothetical protein BJ508DRAFT_382209 [Ascobolus immersus RN42]|uniref:Uncharacterized protein n=1 Tax=Ascobolus immersus RN42 TaxID=1160509 RepID=A0A3N4HFN3_ASCIM|nr:hypothetical protein BJ508DRAFT_382209 [Ascobolus immersus RN42]
MSRRLKSRRSRTLERKRRMAPEFDAAVGNPSAISVPSSLQVLHLEPNRPFLKKRRLLTPEDMMSRDAENGNLDEPVYVRIDRLKTDDAHPLTLLRNRKAAMATRDLDSFETIGGEAFIRTYHPVFEETSYVGIFKHPSGYRCWIVHDPSSAPTSPIAGLYVHLVPIAVVPQNAVSDYGDPLSIIDPRKLLTIKSLDTIRLSFPFSVGCTVYKGGLVNILVPEGKRVVLTRTRRVVEWGMGVGTGPTKNDMGRAGLKIRTNEGADSVVAITVATHVFVTLPEAPKDDGGLLGRSKKALIKISRTKPILAISKSKPIAWCIKVVRNSSPLGKLVFLANSIRPVGKITRTYDAPSSLLPYPAGYTHDLSLVTEDGAPLPQLLPPINGPRLETSFADPEAALGPTPVFTLRQKVQFPDKPEIFKGDTMSREQKTELVEGTTYLWEKDQYVRSLLWRTECDYVSVRGASGSVLCIGSPGQAGSKVQAVVFQNYQSQFPFPWSLQKTQPRPKSQYRPTIGPLANTKALTDVCPTNFTLKGGFFLPDAVKNGTILAERQEAHTWSAAPTTAATVHPSSSSAPGGKKGRKGWSLF